MFVQENINLLTFCYFVDTCETAGFAGVSLALWVEQTDRWMDKQTDKRTTDCLDKSPKNMTG